MRLNLKILFRQRLDLEPVGSKKRGQFTASYRRLKEGSCLYYGSSGGGRALDTSGTRIRLQERLPRSRKTWRWARHCSPDQRSKTTVPGLQKMTSGLSIWKFSSESRDLFHEKNMKQFCSVMKMITSRSLQYNNLS